MTRGGICEAFCKLKMIEWFTERPSRMTRLKGPSQIRTVLGLVIEYSVGFIDKLNDSNLACLFSVILSTTKEVR